MLRQVVYENPVGLTAIYLNGSQLLKTRENTGNELWQVICFVSRAQEGDEFTSVNNSVTESWCTKVNCGPSKLSGRRPNLRYKPTLEATRYLLSSTTASLFTLLLSATIGKN